MRACAEIDLRAIAHNIALIRAKTKAQILAVVKADAYGHGLIPVARTAVESGAQWLGVALLEEAIALRQAGIEVPILAWLTTAGDDFEAALRNHIDLSISSVEIFDLVLAQARKIGVKPRLHFEVDTGMSRGGFLEQWSAFINSAKAAADEFTLVGLWSHFARADEPDEPMNRVQIEEFEHFRFELESAGIKAEYFHQANSAAALTNPHSHRDIVRIGIAMYGLSPDLETMRDSQSLGLIPAMTLKSRLVVVKKVPAGSSVGYGATARLDRDTTLGVVALGYADGIPRNTSSSAKVSIAGQLAPVIGRVSMDQFVVDLGPDSIAKTGDWVEIFGKSGASVDTWAKAAGTINYEIVTRIGPRVPRIYLPNN